MTTKYAISNTALSKIGPKNIKVQTIQPVNAKIPAQKSQTKVIEQPATEEYDPTVSEEPWMVRKTYRRINRKDGISQTNSASVKTIRFIRHSNDSQGMRIHAKNAF